MLEDEQNEQVEQQEVKPVKLGIGATVAVVIGLCIMAFILVFTIKGCSVQKNVTSDPPGQTTESVLTEPSESATNSLSEITNSGENNPDFGGSTSAPGENSTSGNNTSSNEGQSTTNNSDGFTEVADPVMSEVRSAYGMVIGKHIYKKDNSYIYGVSISVIINEQSVSAQYFCPRKTYEELKSGDSLDVTYQVDSNGSLSIYSISRG